MPDPLNPDEQLRMMELWYAALRSEKFGIRIHTDNFEKLRASLYSARKHAQDPDLEVLSLTASPEAPGAELWIIRKRVTITIPDEELDDAN